MRPREWPQYGRQGVDDGEPDWNAENLEHATRDGGRLPEPDAHIKANGVAFSTDGTRLATIRQDGTVRVYFLDLEDSMALALTQITRSAPAPECLMYLPQGECPTVTEALNWVAAGTYTAKALRSKWRGGELPKGFSRLSTLAS